MSFATDVLSLLDDSAARTPLPKVRGLHLPPPPQPGGTRGEFCALELDDGSIGLSYVLLGDTWAGLNAGRGRFALEGGDAMAVARGYASADPYERTVGFAAINALTRCLFDRAGFAPPASGDSVGALDPQPDELIGMIGYFTPLVPRIVACGARLLVLELRQDLVGESGAVRVTLDDRELEGCEKVLATGTLLLNDTLDRVLARCRRASRFAMIGPSVGCLPDPLFARGVTLLGGSWVTRGPQYLDSLRRGHPTADFATKFALAAADYPGWPALLARL